MHRVPASPAQHSPMRIAVLYSGRWFGGGAVGGWQTTLAWAQNHLQHLIMPNNASVFVVATSSTWCGPPPDARVAHADGKHSAAESVLQQEVRAAFRGWPNTHAALVTALEDQRKDNAYHAQAKRVVSAHNMSTSGFISAAVRGWRWQFALYARADQLQRVHGPHDWIVRARLDVIFEPGFPLLVQPLQKRTTKAGSIVFAVGVHGIAQPRKSVEDTNALHPCHDKSTGATDYIDTFPVMEQDSRPDCLNLANGNRHMFPAAEAHVEWRWRDWIFVGASQAMEPLASMADGQVLLSHSLIRCFGLCQEEQTMLQLAHHGVALRPLGAHVQLDRINCSSRESTTPLKQTLPQWASPCFLCKEGGRELRPELKQRQM